MLLHFSTWPEIEAYLTRSTAIVVPIGSNEQHGPTGLLGTDFLCPEIIAHEASKQEGEALLIAPTFAVGMAQHHLGFPGSISLRPTTFIAALTDWTRSLVGHGFERLYFLNGHGGNVATIEAAFLDMEVAELEANAGAVKDAIEHVRALDNALSDAVGAGSSADFSALTGTLKSMNQLLQQQLGRRGLASGAEAAYQGAGPE